MRGTFSILFTQLAKVITIFFYFTKVSIHYADQSSLYNASFVVKPVLCARK